MARPALQPEAGTGFAERTRYGNLPRFLGGGPATAEGMWGAIFVLPYIAVFLLFVVYPVAYGLWLGMSPQSYVGMFHDPIYWEAVRNTLVLLIVGVNVKMFLALVLSGYFSQAQRWVKWLFLVFILPWAVPAIPTFISAHWLLNFQGGMINGFLWHAFRMDGPGWLLKTDLAFGSVVVFYIWKWLPFWTVIMLAGRTAITNDLYEAAAIDGATGLQRFAYVTWPMMRSLYIICTILSTIWTLGDFNTVHFITGGGPSLSTHVLATLGIRDAFEIGNPQLGVATVITALPILIPLVIILIRRLDRQARGEI